MHVEDVVTGGRYRVRQWDDMQAEFGLTSRGDIKCPGAFIKSMRYLCGQTVTVTEKYGNVLFEDGEKVPWTITYAMLEPLDRTSEETEYDPASDSELSDFLFYT